MLSREDVQKIAHLARLRLEDEELGRYQKNLGRVLGHIAELEKLTTAGNETVRHVPKDAVAFRADKAVPFGNVEGLLANATDRTEDSFRLPPIAEAE